MSEWVAAGSPLLTDEALKAMWLLLNPCACADYDRELGEAFLAAQDREALAEVVDRVLHWWDGAANPFPGGKARAVVDALLGPEGSDQ